MTQGKSGGTAVQPTSSARIERWAFGLREAYGERRAVDAAALLRRIHRAMVRIASRPARLEPLLTALREAFPESGVEGKALRADIEILVEGGDMRPSEAEKWASTFGWNPFAGWADPDLFDPMQEEMWSLSMTAAWIRWRELDRAGEVYLGAGEEGVDRHATDDYWRKRDRARVIEQVHRRWPAYIKASTRWTEVEHPYLPEDDHQPVADGDAASRALEKGRCGYVLYPREDRGYSELPEENSCVRDVLHQALRYGRLKATGFRDDAFVSIPVNEWSVLEIIGFHDDFGVHRVVAPGRREIYQAVHVPREQVLAVFPETKHDWTAELESRIRAEGPQYTQARAIAGMKQFAVERGIIVGDKEIKAAWKRIKGVDGKAKPGPTGPRKKAR